MKLSNYSLNYRDLIIQGSMDIFKFLALCRELGLDGASIHLQNLQSTQTDYLKQIRRAYLDNGLSVSMFTVSTDFGQPQERHEEEFKKFRQALRAAELLGAPLIRAWPARRTPSPTGQMLSTVPPRLSAAPARKRRSPEFLSVSCRITITAPCAGPVTK